MSDRLERFLCSTKRRYLLGLLGAGLALGLGVLATNSSLSARDLKVPTVYNVTKEWGASQGGDISVRFFNSTGNAANFTSSYEATSGFVYLTLDNAKWRGDVDKTALCKDVNSSVATYYGMSDNNKTIIYTINSSNPIASGITLFFSNGSCNASVDMNVTITKGTTSNVKVSVKIGNNNEGETDLIAFHDQWKIKEIERAKAYINSTNNTAFKIGNNVTSNYANGTIQFAYTNSTFDFNKNATQFNATVALDKFPSWLKNATSTGIACFPHFNATNYNEASANNCTGNYTVTLTFYIKGNETLSPAKIALSKYEITKVDGGNYTKDLLSAYSGDKTLLEVLHEGLVVYIPRFDHRKEGNPKTYVNLATTKSGGKVKVCKFDGDCYSNEIALDNQVKNLFQRESAIEDFLGGYSGALKLEFINISDPSELVCYTVFVRGDGTVVRVPCLKGSGVEVGAN